MIAKVISKLLGKKPADKAPKRKEYGVKEHKIPLQFVDKPAVDVCNTLQEAGFEAYIVGGAVRDLILGLRPKDFDVATDATPEEVKALFRRAFIIGRRFRIVHVVFGRGKEHEVIEVTTFRANVDHALAHQVAGNEQSSKQHLMHIQHAVDASGRVLRDNVWGSQDDDAARRDFSVNAMYYDPYSQVVVDYHGGMQDAKQGVIRMIGEATTRYREDPIRIIRAVRFAAKLSKLGFKLAPETAKPLAKLKALLADVPPSRMFDEMLKLFQTGHAIASVEQLQKLGLASGLYPLQDLIVERAKDPFVRQALIDTDARVAQGKPVAPSFLLACILWQDVRLAWLQYERAQHMASFTALQAAVDEVFESKIGDISGRGKLGADMREIWLMQPRFEKRSGKAPFSTAAHLRFRAAYDFLRLRSLVGEVPSELPDWWEAFSIADEHDQRDMQSAAQALEKLAQAAHKNTARAAKRPTDTTATDAPSTDVKAAAKRKRRKPKKPASKTAVTTTGDSVLGDTQAQNDANQRPKNPQ